jgi:hypothetical protein
VKFGVGGDFETARVDQSEIDELTRNSTVRRDVEAEEARLPSYAANGND